jgi:Leucine-rich repeat (LRR) protein
MADMTDRELIAEERIAEAARTGQDWLELGDLGLIRLPEGLSRLTQLRRLSLGSRTRLNQDRSPVIRRYYAPKSNVFVNLDALSNLTNLRELYFDGAACGDLGFLSFLPNLQRLDCRRTRARDLTPLKDLQQLRFLDCSNTPIRDLEPLKNLRQLQHLECNMTRVTDLTALADLPNLQHLQCAGTFVRDLTPLRDLRELKHFDCSHTNVTDLTPLMDAHRLNDLRCARTQVSDLTPLLRLEQLNTLDLSECNLEVAPTEIWQKPFLRRLELRNSTLPDIPDEILGNDCLQRLRAYLNEQKHQPKYSKVGPDEPPEMPVPGTGLRVALDATGRLTLAAPSDLDAQGNDRRRLEALHPALREAAVDLVKALQHWPSNLRNDRLLQKAESYRALVDQSLNQVDFTRLYMAGTQLMNAASATRKALEAGRTDVPDLTPMQDECLANIEALHPPFVLASRDGTEMLADQSLIQLTSEDVAAIKVAGTALGNALLQHPDLADPAIGQTIKDAAAEIGHGTNDKRDAATTRSALSNGLIALTAASTVVCLPIAGGWALGGLPGTATGGLAALVLTEAVKKTKAFQVTTGLMAQGFESFTDRQFTDFTAKLKRLREQLVKQEPHLRKIVHIWGFQWLGPSLDWLKRNTPPDNR